MKKFAKVLKIADKEKIKVTKMTIVHKREENVIKEKYQHWSMPAHPERYIKHKQHDPL